VRRDEVLVVVLEGLQAGDVTDGPQRQTADLADALGDIVADRKYLLLLLVKQQMVIAEMRTADMPMKVLGLEI
jgi:hypothetical protein